MDLLSRFDFIIIERKNGEFVSQIGDPAHGGSTCQDDDIKKVIERLLPEIQKPIVEAFEMKNPSKENIQNLFPQHKVLLAPQGIQIR